MLPRRSRSVLPRRSLLACNRSASPSTPPTVNLIVEYDEQSINQMKWSYPMPSHLHSPRQFDAHRKCDEDRLEDDPDNASTIIKQYDEQNRLIKRCDTNSFRWRRRIASPISPRPLFASPIVASHRQFAPPIDVIPIRLDEDCRIASPICAANRCDTNSFRWRRRIASPICAANRLT